LIIPPAGSGCLDFSGILKYIMAPQSAGDKQRRDAKKGRVTIAGHPSKDLHPKTLNSILRQAGLNPIKKGTGRRLRKMTRFRSLPVVDYAERRIH